MNTASKADTSDIVDQLDRLLYSYAPLTYTNVVIQGAIKEITHLQNRITELETQLKELQ